MKQIFLIALALLLWQARPVSADELFLVVSVSDLPDADPGDGVCADSEGDCSLRAGVEEANALPGTDRLVLAGNTPFTLGSQLSVTDDLIIDGNTTDFSIIDGQNLTRLFYVSGVNLVIEDTTLRNGNALGNEGRKDGGAIFTNPATLSQITLDRVIVTSNNAERGGGVHATVSLLRIRDSIVENNTATLSSGGVSSTRTGSVTIVSGSIIRNNVSSGATGGISSSGLQMTNSTIHGNSADGDGGGIGLFGDSSITHLMTQVTVSGNSADGDGGGVWLSDADLQLINVTVTENSAGSSGDALGTGGGIYQDNNVSRVTTRNSIIANNSDPDGAPLGPDCKGKFISEGYNVFGYVNSSLCDISDDTVNDKFNTEFPALDPDLGPLQFNDHDNDGTDDLYPTHVPNMGSPAVNWGNPDGCRTNGSPLINRIGNDQRGADRHQQGRCDAGSAESSHGTPTAVEVSQQQTVNSQPFAVLMVGWIVLLIVTFTVWSTRNDRQVLTFKRR